MCTARAILGQDKDLTSLKEIGLCGPLSTRKVGHGCTKASTAMSKCQDRLALRGLRLIKVTQTRKECQRRLKSTED